MAPSRSELTHLIVTGIPQPRTGVFYLRGDQMIELKYQYDTTFVNYAISSDSNISEVFDHFRRFLLAVSYSDETIKHGVESLLEAYAFEEQGK